MIYTYQGENWCEDCGEILQQGLPPEKVPTDPYNLHTYDSDDYPKPFYGFMESDSIEHCAAGENCINAIPLDVSPKDLRGAETVKVGAILTNTLTSEGVRYTRDLLRDERTPYQSALHDLWKDHFPEIALPEPEPGDYIISPTGRLGSQSSVGIVGAGVHVGTYNSDGEALEAIRKRMDREQYWPNVWILSDHGNPHLAELE